MAVPLTVSGVTYQYPVTDNQEWGTEATNWAIAMTDAMATAVQGGDLAPTILVTIQNGVSNISVTGLLFNSAITQSAKIEYYVYRTNDVTELAESGTIRIVFKDTLNEWSIDRTFQGDDTGLDFDITPSGQIQYTSTTIGATSYTGKMRYRALAVPV